MTTAKRRMANAGKTFFFATHWLKESVCEDTVIVYNFCRTIDDIADSVPIRPTRETDLQSVIKALENEAQSHPLVEPLRPLMQRFPEIQSPLIALVRACMEDVPSLQITDESDLRKYAHGVAGNVGLIMYPLLGGTDPAGRARAAELGVAMQYTNIARDILEDLSRSRIYLPSAWLSKSTENITRATFDKHEHAIIQAVERLLEQAKAHYTSGLSGLAYLHPRNRFAITVAARCYEAIGLRVLRNGKLSRTRAVVPLMQKALLALKIACSWSRQAKQHVRARSAMASTVNGATHQPASKTSAVLQQTLGPL